VTFRSVIIAATRVLLDDCVFNALALGQSFARPESLYQDKNINVVAATDAGGTADLRIRTSNYFLAD
jgi:hypothetical protein